jgi:hypothetical protein
MTPTMSSCPITGVFSPSRKSTQMGAGVVGCTSKLQQLITRSRPPCPGPTLRVLSGRPRMLQRSCSRPAQSSMFVKCATWSPGSREEDPGRCRCCAAGSRRNAPPRCLGRARLHALRQSRFRSHFRGTRGDGAAVSRNAGVLPGCAGGTATRYLVASAGIVPAPRGPSGGFPVVSRRAEHDTERASCEIRNSARPGS